MIGITTKYEVLEAIQTSGRAAEGEGVGVEILADTLGLSEIAAIRHIERLWEQRLIEPVRLRGGTPRRSSVREIASLRFRLTERGQERIQWWGNQGR